MIQIANIEAESFKNLLLDLSMTTHFIDYYILDIKAIEN